VHPIGTPLGVGAVTVTFAVAPLPKESLTWTTSVTPPVGPAVYVPAIESIEPPDTFVASDQMYPTPDPPLP
jgi:hypothetical protein